VTAPVHAVVTCAPRRAPWVEPGSLVALVEPESLIEAYLRFPPRGFVASLTAAGMPTFLAPFDLLMTADDALRARIQRLPLFRRWGRLLTWQARFIGCTVTEYAPLAARRPARQIASELLEQYGREQRILIVKDLAIDSPLLDANANARSRELAHELENLGFVLLDGMSLAWVPMDFPSVSAYIARLSAGRRPDIRRKLKARSRIDIETVPTGSPWFDDDAVISSLYRLYGDVYTHSEVHFDLLTEDFFRALLRDPGSGGELFVYRHAGELIGWKLCYVYGGMLLDKYVGFAYPQSREHNLYFVSWFHCLEVALERGLSHFIAGWTSATIKRYLGAHTTRTRHAAYLRNPLLRGGLRYLSRYFEAEPG
jgi:predicted N-acyltransferase